MTTLRRICAPSILIVVALLLAACASPTQHLLTDISTLPTDTDRPTDIPVALSTVTPSPLPTATLTLQPTTTPTEQPTEVVITTPSAMPVKSTLTLKMLQNAVYQIPAEDSTSAKFQLVDGIYYQTPMIKGEAKEDWFTKLAEPVLIGDLNADGVQDAAVILRSRWGGTGVFVELAAVIDDHGRPSNVSTKPLGDRIQIESGSIAVGIITLNMLI